MTTQEAESLLARFCRLRNLSHRMADVDQEYAEMGLKPDELGLAIGDKSIALHAEVELLKRRILEAMTS